MDRGLSMVRRGIDGSRGNRRTRTPSPLENLTAFELRPPATQENTLNTSNGNNAWMGPRGFITCILCFICIHARVYPDATHALKTLGVFPGPGSGALYKFEDFESLLGRKLKYINVNYSPNQTNSGVSNYVATANAWDYFINTGGTFFTTNRPGNNMADRTDVAIAGCFPITFSAPGEPADFTNCRQHLIQTTNGLYDSAYLTVAQNAVAAGHDRDIFRIGHEFNGSWYLWCLGRAGGASNAQLYIEAFRHVVNVMRSVSTNFRFDYNMDRGGWDFDTHTVDVKSLCYPGDAYVDIIGTDIYDTDPWATVKSNLDEAWSFAVSHNKPFSIPEWGLWSYGDHPAFISNMYQWLTNRPGSGAGALLYHNYFNTGGQPMNSTRIPPRKRSF